MTVHLRLCPNNALLYESTYRLLRTDGITYVSYGLSSLQADANVRAMHAYKTRMGYEAIPCRRAFFFRPVIHSLLTSAPSSHLWPMATRLFPRIELLRKLAGLSRLIAAKDYETVTWVRQATSDQLPEQPLDPESG